MKVGKFVLMTAIMLTWPVMALAGGNPCAPFFDLDADGVCDNVDNCPPGTNWPTGIANPAQTDTDGDGRGDSCDNCRTIDNGPGQFVAGSGTLSQCDKNSDGFGNACSADLNNDGFSTPTDNPVYIAALMVFLAPSTSGADSNCDGFHTPTDNARYIASLMAFIRGPSGMPCVVGGGPSVPASCPSLP